MKAQGEKAMKLFENGKASKLVMIIAGTVAAFAVLFGALCVFTYANDDIFPGVHAGDIKLSGKSAEEAKALIEERNDGRFEDARVTVKLEKLLEREVTAKELGAHLASDEIVEKALSVGHEGGFWKRISEVLRGFFGGVDVGEAVSFGEAEEKKIADEFSKYDVAAVDAAYTIEDETLILHPKADGKEVEKEELIAKLKAAFASKNYEPIEIQREVSESVSLDMDKVYSEVYAEAADAYLEKGEDGNKIVPHVIGMDFDLEAAKIAYDKSSDEVIRIPLNITEPKVLTKHLEINLFKYCLAEVETHFSPKKVARTANVRLAAQLVNGTILNPGEEFSYNKTVGPRTAERGFKAAAIFAQGEVVDGIGGGICQVSSTLYMAAVKANMKIVERKNHAFYVDYAPKGEDATVVYGSIDFRFKNTSEYPVKIVATSKNNYIRIQLMGTEPDELYTVKLTKKTHSQTPFETREKKTTSLAEGKREVEQEGQPGLSMTVYRNVYDKNGKLVESYLENNSKYKPMPKIVLVGTAKSEETVAPPPEEKPQEEVKEPESEATANEELPPAEEVPSEEPPVDVPVEETPSEETPSEGTPGEDNTETVNG